MCRRGNDSKVAVDKILKETEYRNVYNVKGGMDEIINQIGDG